MLKGFTHARLACGCRIGFREGVEGSPVTVVVDEKGPGARSRCTFAICRSSTIARRCVLRRGRFLRTKKSTKSPSASGRRRSLLSLRPAGFSQRLSEQELDLAVQAAQVIVCPALNGVEHVAGRSEAGMACDPPRRLLIDRSRVDDRLRRALAAEHHEQVADHRGLPLVVELDESRASIAGPAPSRPCPPRLRRCADARR